MADIFGRVHTVKLHVRDDGLWERTLVGLTRGGQRVFDVAVYESREAIRIGKEKQDAAFAQRLEGS